MDTLFAEPFLYLLCGLVNIIATFTYIGLLYIMRYVDYSFSVKVAFLSWECLLFIFFTLDSALNFSTSFNKLGYMMSFTGITDLLSLLALTSFIFLEYYTALTLQFFRCFRLLKIMQGVKSYPQLFYFIFIDPVPYEILHTVTSITVLLLVVTGAVQSVSYQYPEAFEAPVPIWQQEEGITESGDSVGATRLYWHECLYFCVVTITTLGYGDIFPVTTLSRMLMVFIIIIAFSLIPTLLSDLVRAFFSRPLYAGSLSLPPGRKHILICGIVNSAMLLQLMLELETYQPTTVDVTFGRTTPGLSFFLGGGSTSVLVVILSPQLPNRKVKLLLDSVLATYARRVMYFVGSTKVTQDLQRVQLKDALAVLILGDEPTSSMRVEEDSIFLSAISISSYLEHSRAASASICHAKSQKTIPIYHRPHIVTILTHTAKLRPLLDSAGVDVVLPFQHFKYSLLGVSAACPGFLALFMKLNRPHFETYAQQYPHYLSNHRMFFRANPTSTHINSSLINLPYLKSTGTEHSIYQISVSSTLPNEDINIDSTNNNSDELLQRSQERQPHESNISDSNLELLHLIKQLPDKIKFQDFVSVVFRLSHGDVVLIGTNALPVMNHHNNFQQDLPQLQINPGRHVQINKCMDLFCIAKSRPTAVNILKLACQKIQSHSSIDGPRGSWILGCLESLADNLLLREYSHSSVSRPEGEIKFNHVKQGSHATETVDDMKLDNEQQQRAFHKSQSAPQLFHVLHGALEKENLYDQKESCDISQQKRSTTHQARTKPKTKYFCKAKKASPVRHTKKRAEKYFRRQGMSKQRSRYLLQSINLKKLSPFSFPHHDDDSMSAATGHSATSSSACIYDGNSARHAPTTLIYDRNSHLNAYQFTKSFSREPKQGTAQEYVIGYAHPPPTSCSPLSKVHMEDAGDAQQRKSQDMEGHDVNHNALNIFNDFSSSNHTSRSHDINGDDNDNLHNHLVLILSSSGTKDTIAAHALLLPIIHILTSYRAHSPNDKVIILSERADELYEMAVDTSVVERGILKNVYYYLGSPRNIDHLRLCAVLTARAVVIFHHPTPSTVFVQGDDDPSGQTIPRKLNADRHTIIISLNLHFLLEQQNQLPHPLQRDSGFLRNDNYCPFTFAVAEVRHESNVAYLRRSISTISSTPSTQPSSAFGFNFHAHSSLETNNSVFQTPGNSHFTNNASRHSGNCFDMLSAGGVMTAPVFISLLLQSILNPNIVTLWEHMLGGSISGSHGIDDNLHHPSTNINHQNKQAHKVASKANIKTQQENTIAKDFEGNDHKKHTSKNESNCHFTKLKKNQTIAQAKRPLPQNTPCTPSHAMDDPDNTWNHLVPSSDDDKDDDDATKAAEFSRDVPILGRIACPDIYTGLTYGILFEDLLERSGVVCMGVHRLTAMCAACTDTGEINNHDDRSQSSTNVLQRDDEASHQHQRLDNQQKQRHKHNLSPHSGSATGLGSNSSGQGGVVLNSDIDDDEEEDDDVANHTKNNNNEGDDDDVGSDASSLFTTTTTADATSSVPALDVSIPYVFIAPSSDFLMHKDDYVFILRCA